MACVKRLRPAVPALTAFILALVCASGASAGTVKWGISGVTPTLNTANGDGNSAATQSPDDNACPNGLTCSPQINKLSGTNPVLPAPFEGEDRANAAHAAEDLGVWNPKLAAPSGGQVLQILVTGCAVKNTSSPTQDSQGIPVNTVLFQTLSPSGSDWTVDDTAGAPSSGPFPFQVPFCKTAANPSGVAPSTVTTFRPVHLCLSAGDVVTFHDLGGFVEDNGADWYPQGIPMEVLAPVSGVSTDSFVGVDASPIGPGIYGPGNTTDQSGYATEADQELTMEIVEGTGNDAYGLCPGGFGDEPSTANTIDCDFRTTADGTNTANPAKYPDHPFCAEPDKPIPGSNVPPPPVLSGLKLSPAVFVAERGSTISYTDSEPGTTTLRIYRVEGRQQTSVRTVRHQDTSQADLRITGLKPGSYVVEASPVYIKVHGRMSTARFTVIASR
jgi:hypothetical protein